MIQISVIPNEIHPSENSDSDYKFSQEPQPFNQKELSDLVKDLNLPKEVSGILASRLKGRKMCLLRKQTLYFIVPEEKSVTVFFSREGFRFL
ncbi:hypothetical protein TNCV_3213991 [Trichonephila clavipes]|nr:hypothetical protein TNCV_3213991 [Trichonephila clavipes]